jgi:dihydropteroate synthase
MKVYFRPLTQYGPERPTEALAVAGGWCWFTHVEAIERGRVTEILVARDLPKAVKAALTKPRSPAAGLSMLQPRLMGILNVTPDSFSDGGEFSEAGRAIRHAMKMVDAGADIIDVGGESTRPGAVEVSITQEIERTVPVIQAMRERSATPVSIDTRKGDVVGAAIVAGASILNDVSALSFDPQIIDIAIKYDVPVCLMHAQGEPKTMQNEPVYEDVLLDVFDYLEARISHVVEAGIRRKNIIVDPGIGFGKTLEHNLRLLQNLSLFHTLGCPILLGASRKRFIGTLGDAPETIDRIPGSVAVALAGIAQGVQITRVHDISETRQALTLWSAATGMRQD